MGVKKWITTNDGRKHLITVDKNEKFAGHLDDKYSNWRDEKEAKKKYQQAMKQLAGKDGKIDLNNGDVYDEVGKIRDEYNDQKWRRQGLSDEEIYQKWEESQG